MDAPSLAISTIICSCLVWQSKSDTPYISRKERPGVVPHRACLISILLTPAEPPVIHMVIHIEEGAKLVRSYLPYVLSLLHCGHWP